MSAQSIMGRFIPEQFNKPRPATMKLVCRSFRSLRKNTLIGFAEISIPDLGMTVRDVAIHTKNGSTWASPPSKPQVKDGALVKDETGKIAYAAIIEFGDRTARDRFSAAVIQAVFATDGGRRALGGTAAHALDREAGAT
jgi:hypothetical protein